MDGVRGTKWGGVAARFAGFGLAFAVFGAVGLVGCAGEPDGYDPEMRYPLRADAIVVQPPPSQPARPAEPGTLDEWRANLSTIGGQVIDPAKLPDADKQTLQKTLDDLFGTPATPKVPIAVAATDPHLFSAEELAKGSKLYRRHCANCHGLTGDGRGLTGLLLYPYPRDFRQGVFKTASGPAAGDGKPSLASLRKVVRGGVPGTSMPRFDLLTEADINAMVGFVVHLSLRGETETRTMILDSTEGDVTEAAQEADRSWKRWQAAFTADDPPVSANLDLAVKDENAVRRGFTLFTETAGCAACHADFGRTEQYRYDVWGGAVRVPDLTRGEHRWGKEPADLARRVRYGIPGSGMPANPTLTDEQVRDLVAFLQALPAPPRLPADVRQRIYPGAVADASAMRR